MLLPPLPRIACLWIAVAVLASGCSDRDAAGPAQLAGPQGLARCPTLRPLNPRPLAPGDRNCQAAIAGAGTTYVAALLAAESACVAGNHPGPDVEGDPIHPCVGLRELSTGAYRAPADETTADATAAAADAFARAIRSACDDATVARLDSCASTVDDLIGCLRADHWEAAQVLLRQQYGDLLPVEGPGESGCRSTIGAASFTLLREQAEAMADCLLADDRVAGHAARTCIGEVDDGVLIPPADPTTADRLRSAATAFGASIASTCADEHMAQVDSCGDDRASAESCLLCAHRREAILLVQSQFGGVADRATTHFIDWANVSNPVVSWPDRRIKDQFMALHEDAFYVFGSVNFADDDPDRDGKFPTFVRSHDWRTWEEFPVPFGGFASPDLTRHQGLWYVVMQRGDPDYPENRALWMTTTPDFFAWSPLTEIAPNVLSDRSIIDGALAHTAGRTHLLLKWRVEDIPWVAITSANDLSIPWDFDQRLTAGNDHPFHGFAENGQFIEIDGRFRMLATARDPEGFRCGSIYTCSHEPFLYDFASGDGTNPEDWTEWRHKTQLRIPYEDWNPVMHANTGFLSDWREQDGFFYLSYSGSADSERFQGRGHGKIGLARSRDLLHWRLPGDLRD